ncbi:hypothetical protein DB347_09085 [Opitutaceae bacterium EW11]|nr:hypothetical protein DB347_09085 [Opitutaceae bacterium EW11]
MNTSLRNSLQFAAVLSATALLAQAASQSFDFKDPKGVNNVQFKLDAPLESVTGTANGVSGTVAFDADHPETTRGKIVLDAASLTVGNPLMREHLHSDKWLDVANHPSIVFEATGASNVRKQGAQVLADITGTLTVKGVAKAVTVPVTFTYLPDRLGARLGKPELKGDLLVLRANFQVNRSDFGIQPGQMTDKVAEAIDLSLSIAGSSPRT